MNSVKSCKKPTSKSTKKSKSCLVLDIDGTLLGSSTTNNSAHRNKYKTHDGESTVYCYIRPGTKRFLKKCRKIFDVVGIWSHGTKEWVEACIKHLKLPPKFFNFVMCRQHPGDWTKPLRWIHKKYNTTPERTVMLDDTPEVVTPNKENVIIVPYYISRTADNAIPLLGKYLEHLVHCEDFRDHTFVMKESLKKTTSKK